MVVRLTPPSGGAAGQLHLKAGRYQYQRVIPRGTAQRVRSDPHREGPTSLPCEKGIIMKPTLKWYAHRATIFLGSLAAFAFVIDGAKRW